MAAAPSSGVGSGRPRRRVALLFLAALTVTVAVTVIAFRLVRDVRAPLPPGVRALTVVSPALGRAMPVQAWVPPGTPDDARLPVVVLLHGAGGDEATWFGGTLAGGGLRADEVAAALIAEGRVPPVVLVAPAIAESYGVDSAAAADDRWDHGAYGTYLRDELLPRVRAVLPVSEAPGDTFMAGLSMGGFAALHLALRDPGSVAGVGALSPAVWVDLPADRGWIQAPGGDRAGHDPLELARTAPLDGLRVFLGRGDRDDAWVTDGTDTLAARMAERGREVGPMIVPGGHEAATWHALTAPMLESLLGG